jgi:hydrogenase maturation protease
MNDALRTHPRIAVIGLGNVLLGDDGFGPTVVERLRSSWRMPDNVELIDAGTPSLDLADYMYGCDEVILLDAIAADAPPGQIRIYSGTQLMNLPLKQRVSPHDPALQEALWIAEIGGAPPRATCLIGAVPMTSEPGVGLSRPMQTAVDEATFAVIDRLESLGCVLDPSGGRRSRAWWLVDSSVDGPRRTDLV